MAIIDGDGGNDTLTGTPGNDRIRGLAGNDWLYGLAGGDRLEGGTGRDNLRGGNGADLLIGGLGRDTMHGGSGRDTFRFDDRDAGDATAGPLSDVILDFSASDVLDLIPVDILGFGGWDVRSPQRGEFGIWQAGGSAYVTWNTFGSFHDVELRGFTGDPFSQIRWYDDDYAANVNTTGRIAVGQTRRGEIEVSYYDQDWFRVSLDDDRIYNFEVGGAGTGNGTLEGEYLTILDENGNYLAANYSALEFVAPSAGVYYVAVSSDWGATGTYALSMAARTLVDDYAGDFSTTGRIETGQTTTGEIEWSGDRDWFQTTLEQDSIYRFDVQGSSDGGGTLGDAWITVYDSDGNYVADGYEEVSFRSPDAGTYYVEVNGGGYSSGTYSLAAAELVDSYADNSSTTGTIAPDETVASAIEYSYDRDWFRIAMEVGQTYTIDLKGQSSGSGTLNDPVLVLLDEGGVAVATNDDWNGLDSRITYAAEATGDYFIEASEYDIGTGTYELSVVLDDAALV